MAISTSALIADMVAVESDLSNVLTWTPAGGALQTVTCLAGEDVRDDSRNQLGIYQDRDREVIARIGLFTGSVVPSVGNQVAVDGTSYRISRVEKSADGIQVRLNLTRV